MRRVEILRNQEPAGILTEESSSKYIFRYHDQYFSDNTKPSISLTLAKTQQEYISDHLFPFFYNMLAEGVNRQLQCRIFRIDETDHFGLLAATAQFDTIGAITVKALAK